MRDIAIVGGGPAGALCGERLASSGFRVSIYDEHLAWEKPCGGGLTQKALLAYPYLREGPYPKKVVSECELISSSGLRALLLLDRPIVIYSRKVLNGLLLDRAAAAGCQVVRSRVTHVDTSGPGVRLTASGRDISADFVVLAAGARNPLLPGTTPLKQQDLELTVGYFIPAASDRITVKFLSKFPGYIWSFPRSDHLSVGICGRLTPGGTRVMKEHLHRFLEQEGIPWEGAAFYSHVLPSPQVDTLRRRRVVGRNWGLVGDAAAWVDPLTGEGLHYALRSGNLLADALAEGCPEKYPALVRREFAADFEFAVHAARRLFTGTFLGGAVTTRMIQFVHRSPAFCALMRDLFSGAQDYRTLKRRLWSQLGLTLGEIFRSFFRPAPSPRSFGAVPD
ncbi:MAG TPA: NAD(P)/FAD-dependent oxidoreductase [Candidatus Acidoferrales bacterium]|nr:NAD(P)/FAD-dependent oxidoreductase [Candidatus Acidoferrales bacterium]